jgi:hypothetical protein
MTTTEQPVDLVAAATPPRTPYPPGSHHRSAASAPLGREDTDAPDRVPREPTKVVVSHRRLPSVDSVVSPA